ncbi:aldo/keto reductase [Microcystis aeruginosa FBCC-A68]|uniref:aldo/keto reductase n=1 Tax=Microcystis aeruginosa TaxID=1126 RepID=UPI001BAFDAE3|nr:aldo/keto reductase [Microcystis aeruginosa]
MTIKKIKIGNRFEASAIALGCMRISNMSRKEIATLLQTALNCGVNFFDHADIYGGGQSEINFARAMKDAAISREKVVVQTKCGINKISKGYFFDFSREHIIASLEDSLKRLEMDYVDVLLLHRPDTLMEPEEVAEAFNILYKAGKVRYFGVSNHNPGQIRLLSKYLGDAQRIIINQLQFSPTNAGIIDVGLYANMQNSLSIDRDGSILEFCRLEDITIQAWSPFQYGFFEGVFLGSEKYSKLNQKINELAVEKMVSHEAIVTAWILRHPAKIQIIPGTTNAERVKRICEAYTFDLTREEWYEIYCATGKVLP